MCGSGKRESDAAHTHPHDHPSSHTRASLITATLHLVNREFDELAADMVALGFFPPGADMNAIGPALTGVFLRALANAGGVAALSFSDLSADLGRTMYEYNFRLPPYYTLLVRSLSVLEGIALAADPNYKVLAQALPWVSRRALTSREPAVRDALRALLYKGGDFRFDRLERLLLEAARSPPRPDAEAAARARGAGPDGGLALLLSPDADFVRGIVVDELAKAIDAGARVGADGAVAGAAIALRAVASAAPPLAPRAPPRALANALDAVPALASAADAAQVDGVARLVAAFGEMTQAQAQRAAAAGGGGGATTTTTTTSSTTCTPLASLRAALPPSAATAMDAAAKLASEALALPPDARAEALALPLRVAASAASRAVARGLRGAARLGPAAAAAAPVRAPRPTAVREEEETRRPPPPPPPQAQPTVAPQVAAATGQARVVVMRPLEAPRGG